VRLILGLAQSLVHGSAYTSIGVEVLPNLAGLAEGTANLVCGAADWAISFELRADRTVLVEDRLVRLFSTDMLGSHFTREKGRKKQTTLTRSNDDWSRSIPSVKQALNYDALSCGGDPR
jgi:hypothetical protein